MDLFAYTWLGKPLWMWLGFLLLVVVVLAVDLGLLHRKERAVGMRESLMATGVYALLACLYAGWIGWEMGGGKALQFLTGYVVEFSLSMDNVFVMAVIISFFKVPAKYQYRVLVWGILGAIVLRGIMIGVGAALIEEFHWILYGFGAFLVYLGIKMLVHAGNGDEKADIKDNRLLRLLTRYGRVTKEMRGGKFWVRLKDPHCGRMAWYMTPLMTALVMINLADIVFAVDSVPAIFSITTDTFIVYTSNIFAILGLRSLYFALASIKEKFDCMEYALALVLVFIGGKILLELVPWMPEIPPVMALFVTFGLLGGGVVYSVWRGPLR